MFIRLNVPNTFVGIYRGIEKEPKNKEDAGVEVYKELSTKLGTEYTIKMRISNEIIIELSVQRRHGCCEMTYFDIYINTGEV